MTPSTTAASRSSKGRLPDKRKPMGLALYTRSSDGALFAIVSRKDGPSGAYLWQYRHRGRRQSGAVTGTKVREFGILPRRYHVIDEGETKIAEIEAIAVDNELGFIYYSDELGRDQKIPRGSRSPRRRNSSSPSSAPTDSPRIARASRSTRSTTEPATFWFPTSRPTPSASSSAKARPTTRTITISSRSVQRLDQRERRLGCHEHRSRSPLSVGSLRRHVRQPDLPLLLLG